MHRAVEVPERTHDFGTIESGSTVRHAFVLKNTGTGTLTLEAGPTSCSACTIAELDKNQVPPGASTQVVVEYKTGQTSNFRQTATVLTNDPDQPRVELTVFGTVHSKFDIQPPVIFFGNVPAGEPATAETWLLQFVEGDLHVGQPELASGGPADDFEFRVEPLPDDQLPPKVVAGYRVLATAKPGLPLGPFRRTIRLAVDFGEERTAPSRRFGSKAASSAICRSSGRAGKTTWESSRWGRSRTTRERAGN